MKKQLIRILKVAVPLAIIGFLLSTVDPDQFRQLRDRPKNWPLLTAALGFVLGAVCITFARWYLLVRALEIPFRMRDAFRLGFLGYLFNFVGVGSVGGDLFKAVFIAHEQPGRRAESIATVVVDRMSGLYALLVVASCGVLFGGLTEISPVIGAICNITLIATVVCTLVLFVVIMPGINAGHLTQRLNHLPKVGPIIARLAAAGRMYRDRLGVIAIVNLLSVIVHVCFAFGIYLTAVAIFPETPTLREHFVIVPLSLLAGAMPFTPAGLGTFEVAMERLYALIPAGTTCDGIIVALGYRILTIAVAAIGAVVYWTSRREMDEIIEETEAELEAAHQPHSAATVGDA